MVIRRILGLVMLSSAVLSAQDVGLTARAEKQQIRLGEPVTVTITARLGVEVDSIGPLPVDSVGLFDVLGYTRNDDEHEWTFELMTIDTGKVFLPPIAFGYLAKGDTAHQTAYANSLLFTVAGIDVAPDADIKDIKPPMSAPWGWGDIWPYLLAAGLLAGGWFVYRKYFSKGPEEPDAQVYVPPATPPHIQALRELRELEEKKLWQQGSTKQYYSECTEIIRRFFEGRFGFPSLEQTSDETIEELQRKKMDQVGLAAVREFFERADMVKFAKGQPSPDEHQRELTIAYDIVRSMTEEAREPATTPEETVAG